MARVSFLTFGTTGANAIVVGRRICRASRLSRWVDHTRVFPQADLSAALRVGIFRAHSAASSDDAPRQIHGQSPPSTISCRLSSEVDSSPNQIFTDSILDQSLVTCNTGHRGGAHTRILPHLQRVLSNRDPEIIHHPSRGGFRIGIHDDAHFSAVCQGLRLGSIQVGLPTPNQIVN